MTAAPEPGAVQGDGFKLLRQDEGMAWEIPALLQGQGKQHSASACCSLGDGGMRGRKECGW